MGQVSIRLEILLLSVSSLGLLIFGFTLIMIKKLKDARTELEATQQRTYEFTKNAARKIQVLSRINTVIASSFNREQLMSQILLLVSECWQGSKASLALVDGSEFSLITTNKNGAISQLSQENRTFFSVPWTGLLQDLPLELQKDLSPSTNYVSCHPLIGEESLLGSLIVANSRPLDSNDRVFLADLTGQVCSAIQNVKTSKQKDNISDYFGRNVDPKIRDLLIRQGGKVLGEKTEATVLFFDIRNFTTLSEKLDATCTVIFLNTIFSLCDEEIQSQGGFINKFTGDGFMALFGLPLKSEGHANKALVAALNIRSGLRKLTGSFSDLGIETFAVGMGISTGELVAGTIGSAKRMEYTTIGDTVNIAARVESLCKDYPYDIIASKAVVDGMTPGLVETRYLGPVLLKGKGQAIEVYGIL